MPPILALLLCTLFVIIYLLRYDRRQAEGVTGVLWLPTIWMFSIATKSIGLWLGAGETDIEAGSPLDRTFLSVLLIVGLLVLLKRGFNLSAAIRENKWLILLLCYMLVSVVWSESPFISFKRWTRELIAVVMAFVVLSEPRPQEAMQSLLRRSVYVLIPFSILVIKYFPDYGVQYSWSGQQEWVGVTVQKNGLGRLCMIATFFLIWTLIKRWQGRDVPVVKYQTHAEIVLLGLTLFVLKGPPGVYPATAVAALLVGVAAYLALLWMKKRGRQVSAGTLTITLAAVIALGIITPFVGGSIVAGFASIFGRDMTLTGRSDIWAGVLPFVEQAPFLGSGFGVFWTPEMITAQRIGEAHNGYLDVLLNIGSIGLLLTAIFLLSCGRKAKKILSYDFDLGSLCICMLLMAVVHNVTESSINSFTNQLTALILFLSVALSTAATRPLLREYSGAPQPNGFLADSNISV